MKKILISLSLALTSFAFAEQVDWETFQQRIFKEYPSVEYVAYSTTPAYSVSAGILLGWSSKIILPIITPYSLRCLVR